MNNQAIGRWVLVLGLVILVFSSVAIGIYWATRNTGIMPSPSPSPTPNGKKPYTDAGLTLNQTASFIQSHPEQDGNSTWVNFAKAWVTNQTTADEVLADLGNLELTLDFLHAFPNHDYKDIINLYAKNATLAKIVVDQIDGDGRIPNKDALIREVMPAYLEMADDIQRMAQIYGLNNATAYFGILSAMREEISNNSLKAAVMCLGQNDGINIDFDSMREHASMFRLAHYVSNILKYPKEWKEGAIQIDDIVYKACNLPKSGEIAAWTDVIKPAVKYIIDKIDSGEIPYHIDASNAFWEAQFRRQRLLPLELFGINIVTGESGMAFGNATFSLETAKFNVTPNSNLGGKSPQQWLEDMAKSDFANKTPRYQLTIDKTRITYPTASWPKSEKARQEALDIMFKEDPTEAYITLYPRAIASEYMDMSQVVPMKEQTIPYYGALLRGLGRATLVIRDTYVRHPWVHDESYVMISTDINNKLSQNGELLVPNLFGGWTFKDVLNTDHTENPLDNGNPRGNPIIKLADGNWMEIPLG